MTAVAFGGIEVRAHYFGCRSIYPTTGGPAHTDPEPVVMTYHEPSVAMLSMQLLGVESLVTGANPAMA